MTSPQISEESSQKSLKTTNMSDVAVPVSSKTQNCIQNEEELKNEP